MNREDILFVGCGGCGNKIVDELVNLDSGYNPLFINTSKTDIEDLDNADNIDKNYYLVSSSSNGTGRNRKLGKMFVSKKINSILNMLLDSDKEVIWLVSSLGGGSGSSISSSILYALDSYLKDGNTLDKIINFIGVLPRRNSPEIIIHNAIDTWNELLTYKSLSGMLFINNDARIDGKILDEDIINHEFVTIFDSIFDIPVENGRNFDNGNLRNLLTAKGCMYLYDLPIDGENISTATKQAEKNSIFACLDKEEQMIDVDNGLSRIKCSYIGTSFYNESYSHEEVLYFYKPTKESYMGINTDEDNKTNLLLISGAMPPYHIINELQLELDSILQDKENENRFDYSKFKIPVKEIEKDNTVKRQQNTIQSKIKNSKPRKKKRLKKNLLDGML